MAESKARYTKSSQTRDLEERLESGNVSTRVVSTSEDFSGSEDDGNGRTYAVEGNKTDGYLNTSPEYQTYANDTEKPLRADDGVTSKLEGVAYETAAEVEGDEESPSEGSDEKSASTDSSQKTAPATKKTAASGTSK